MGLLLAAVVAGGAGCGDNEKPPGIADGIFANLGEPLPSATAEQKELFYRGLDVGKERFSADNGLGPVFNVTFCLSCHERPVFGGSSARYRNFNLVGSVLPDGSFVGTGTNGVQDLYSIGEETRVPTDPSTTVIATRNAIPFFGAGLLAAIPDEEILSRADPADLDGDGISGRANYDRGFVGRFGRKSQTVALESFIRGPLFNHLGVTTNPLSPERRAELPVSSGGLDTASAHITPPRPPHGGVGTVVLPQVGAPDEPTVDDDGIPDPEMSEDELFDLISFTMLTAAPQPDPPTADSEAGRQLFAQMSCTGCHVPALRGPKGLIPAYSDLLLHDMGPDLADGVIQGEASGSELRTQPLWGVAAVSPYLHDGRADTLDEAIRWHGGEAQRSRDAYAALSSSEQAQVVAFLMSLGGRSQRTPGLLPPNAPLPAAGEFGGPMPGLSDSDLVRFQRGRELFDRDFGMAAGVGPLFNGDACRACHFDPLIGGSGPAGVSAIRHGIVDEQNNTFTAPSIGTIAHRETTAVDGRAPSDPNANFFEARQTPPLFGLGLVDRIPESAILARADPDDTDGDGISGRANVLGDGRVGRLGWKANVPSLAEFARDGLTNEMGITLPDQPNLTFGLATDGDDVTDPEISAPEVEDLVYFMEQLAPPPRHRVSPDDEDAGEVVFSQIGCNKCHVPELRTADNTPVPLYSDLLVHDVAPPYRYGIADGAAEMREIRTAPLWGLSSSAPYLHDGSAATVEEAIVAHGAEGDASRQAYLDLPRDKQRQLIKFLDSL